jgi:chromosome segregation ATPase
MLSNWTTNNEDGYNLFCKSQVAESLLQSESKGSTPGGHMANVYESLKGSLQRSKPANSVAVARVKGSEASNMNSEMEQLEKIVVERLGKLRAALKEGEAVVASENQHTEQVIESLRTEIAAQQAQLNAARDKELATQKMEQTLNAKIHDLQNDVKKKEEALESRSKEANDLKSKIDALGKQITQSESAIQQAKTETANEAKRAQQLVESSNGKIAALEAQVKDREAIIRAKESALKSLEQRLNAKVQALESLVKNKDTLLTDQDRHIRDLSSQLATLTNGIRGMSSFFKEAEVLTQELKREKEKPANAQPKSEVASNPSDAKPKSAEVASNTPDAAREAVPAAFFDSVTRELAEINGPLAPMIIRDHVKALGESIEKFPKKRVSELVKVLSEEITDEKVKNSFRKRITEEL